jgi:hypothetical protein
MILPSKKLRPQNSLIYIGGTVLTILDQPKTVSQVWEEFKSRYVKKAAPNASIITYDWFVLALDLLFTLGTVELLEGRLRRRLA